MQPHDHSDPSSGTSLNPVDGVWLGEDERYLLDKSEGRVSIMDTQTGKEAYIPEGFGGDITGGEPDADVVENMVKSVIDGYKGTITKKAEEVIESFSMDLSDVPTEGAEDGQYLVHTEGGVEWVDMPETEDEDTVVEDFRFHGEDIEGEGTYTIARFTTPPAASFVILRSGIRNKDGDSVAGLSIQIYDHDNDKVIYSTEENYWKGEEMVNVGNRDIEFRAVNQRQNMIENTSGNITGEMS